MKLSDVREWLKTQVDCPQWFINGVTMQVDECIAIYNTEGAPPRMAIGGLDNTTYTNKPISVLVHWGIYPDPAEEKAQEVYNAFQKQKATIGGKRVIMFDMRHSGPISVGLDDEGIHEYVIPLNIIYER